MTAKFVQPDYTTQTGTEYPLGLDAMAAVFKRFGDAFAPRAQDTPNMTIALDAGYVYDGTTLLPVATQNTGTITAPSSNPRIDRVLVDGVTGVVFVATGAEAALPVPPAIPLDKFYIPVAQIALSVGLGSIGNSIITDERVPVTDYDGVPNDIFYHSFYGGL